MLDFLDLVDRNVDKETKYYGCIGDYLLDMQEDDEYSLGIIHFNIRSLQKHFDELLVYVQSAKDLLNIIVLSETGKIANIHDYSIPGYNVYYNESYLNKCDGAVIYIKSNISANVKIVSVGIYKFLRVTLNANEVKLVLTAIYRVGQ